MTKPVLTGRKRRWILWAPLLTVIFLSLLGGAVMFGYYTYKLQWNPLYHFVTRVENKLNRMAGGPSETEQKTALIETTFLRLRGEVYTMPGNDWINGGATTVWGDNLMVMNHLGKFLILNEGKGLRYLDIVPPENGFTAYKDLSKTPKYAAYNHSLSRFRYNDVKWIDAPDLRGFTVSYTYFDTAKECYGTRISWLPVPAEITDPRDLSIKADAWKTVFDTYPCLALNPEGTALAGLAAGGRIVFQAPSTLYLGSGDYSLDGIQTYDVGIQSDDNAYGKVMAIDLKTGASRIVAKGLRNMQGIAIDKAGNLWTTEHGLRGGDELNMIVEGGNYGWPEVSLGTLYSGLPIPGEGEYGQHEGYRKPAFAWLPSAAVSSLTAINGIDPSWDGDLLAGSLSSPEFGQSLWHIRTDAGHVVFVERIELARRVRHLSQFGEHKIAVWLDTNELVVFTAERRADPLARVLAALADTYDATTVAQVTRALQSCNECHSYEQFQNAAAPSLNGVVGRPIAVTDFEGYSDGLRAVSGKWTPENLKAFLTNPTKFAPGTLMEPAGISDPAVLDVLIWALDQANTEDDTHLTYN